MKNFKTEIMHLVFQLELNDTGIAFIEEAMKLMTDEQLGKLLDNLKSRFPCAGLDEDD